jgi:putative RecB family exonuclease
MPPPVLPAGRKLSVFSHSRLSSYENCPRQYCYRYVDEVKTDVEGVEAFVGKRVHEVLERLYHHVRQHGRPPSLAQVFERFRRDWKQHWHARVRIVRSENDESFYVDHGERCLGNYYRAEYPFDQTTVGIEHPITLVLDEAGHYRMRGVIDRIVRTGDGRYEVHDYKTGAYLPPKARLERDRQLALYQIGIEQTYPDVQQVELVWHYLAFNRTIRQQRSPEDLVELRRETIGLIDEVVSAREFPARPSQLCRWCEFREICPAGGGESIPAVSDDDTAEAPPFTPPVAADALLPRGQLTLL